MFEPLLKTIQRFCRITGMAETAFSRKAFADSRMVFDLKRGRVPGPEMVKRAHLLIEAETQRFRMIADTLDALQVKQECDCFRCTKERVDANPRRDGFAGQDARMLQMFLCPSCGNKRCPGAADHRNECTGSNRSGQKGSLYEDVAAA